MRKRSRPIKIKIPDSNIVGMTIIRKSIPRVSNDKLHGIVGIIEQTPDGKHTEELKELLRNEFMKRGLEIPQELE